MEVDDARLTRRDVLALCAALASHGLLSGPAAAAPVADVVPTRPFGRSGERVSILGLGGFVDPAENPELLALAFRRGVRFWEATLAKGAKGYGAYFRSHPEHREQVFLLAKAREATREALDRDLTRTLEEAATGHVDLFIVQGVSDPGVLGDDLRRWADAQKRAGRIRHFGFSTHANMVPCLERAAALPWIDGVVTAYNYRLMERSEMRDAIEACAQAGIALAAIKTQALPTNPAADVGAESGSSEAALEPLAGGHTPEQAKLRAVWADARISTALSYMRDAKMLEANCEAARAPALTREQREALSRHARATSASYCAGCTAVCESRVAEAVPIGDVMRQLMYANGYRDPERARRAFARLPAPTRRALASADYTAAQRACPQGIDIARLMREASALLG